MALMALVRFGLLVFAVQRVVRLTDAVSRTFSRPLDAPRIPLQRAARRLRQAAKYCPVQLTCLAEALASKALLARYGHSGELCVGVLKTDGKFEAHAWLECENHVLVGNPMPGGKQYVRLEGAEGFTG
jgi:hypothetical protein